jgi:DNA replication and repair protein RecF
MGTLSHLRLRQFRNYTELDADFCSGVNLIVGRNGQGKSNILEAVCYLGLLRSFRTHRIASLRQWHCDSFSVGGEFQGVGDELPFTLSVAYGDRRILRLNGQPVTRASEFINRFLCVPFVPEDLELVKGPASGRRRFMDIVMSQLDAAYMVELQRYQDALRERNAMLREPDRYPASAMAAYDHIVATHGAGIMLARERFCDRFDTALHDASETLLADSRGRLSARHSWGVPASLMPRRAEQNDAHAIAELFAGVLSQALEQDKRDGSTRYGPHRGDIMVMLDGHPLGLYGSEGERRLASLAMRLASLKLLNRAARLGDHGVTLLVDDVLGELDVTRKQAFVEQIEPASQVLITVTEKSPDLIKYARNVLHVEDGKVTTE